MMMKIALAGNPNCGKTTLFNALTGSNQFVGNWPGVTVEKKEGKLKGHSDMTVTDLPGIYSLSPYSPEEVVAGNYLTDERPDVILNIVDGTNLERNLYLTTQLAELGIPMVVAVNMMDLVEKNGDKIDLGKLSRALGCPVVSISALKEKGVKEAAEAAIEAAKSGKAPTCLTFSEPVEQAITGIGETARHAVPAKAQRFYAVKLFERDERMAEKTELSPAEKEKIEQTILAVEKAEDNDAESIITSERYDMLGKIVSGCYRKGKREKLSPSDKIDRIVTNRFLGLPIFALIMFLVYWISMVGVGLAATDWVNDGVFGDGWHLFGIGSGDYESAAEEYAVSSAIVDGYDAYIEENGFAPSGDFPYEMEDEETLAVEILTATAEDYQNALKVLEAYGEEPDPADFGVWVPGIPALIERALDGMKVSEEGAGAVIRGIMLDGIVAGVGAVLGFLPQMFVLFFLLAFLEACGYMARIAFVLDRIFRRFGLSGKSFIPMLIGTGCGIPGIMASRTIENERDRRMTVMTTTFIPCSAKIPFIAMIAGAIFGGSAWVATSAYFVGMLSIILSGLMLKKTKMFAGDPAPFVMELPAYHLPTVKNLLRSTWERGSSFVKKAGTIILLSTVIVWFTTYFGFAPDGFRMLEETEAEWSLLAGFGRLIAWIFIPLGFGNWQAAVASVTGLIAKENIVGTLGILYGGSGSAYEALRGAFSSVSGYAFLLFNLLCAPCFAAIGAIRREMNSAKWTWFAILYQTAFAYAVALIVNQFGSLFSGHGSVLGVIFAAAVLAFGIYLLVRPARKTEASRISSN